MPSSSPPRFVTISLFLDDEKCVRWIKNWQKQILPLWRRFLRFAWFMGLPKNIPSKNILQEKYPWDIFQSGIFLSGKFFDLRYFLMCDIFQWDISRSGIFFNADIFRSEIFFNLGYFWWDIWTLVIFFDMAYFSVDFFIFMTSSVDFLP